MPETPTGFPRQSPHPAYVVLGIVILIIVVLVVLRIANVIPRPTIEPKPSPQREAFSKTYIPLAAIGNRLFYYDRIGEKVCEYENKICKERKSLPSVDAAVLSPDQTKLALLTVKVLARSGIFVLDVSAVDGAPVIDAAKAEWLPDGYIFQADSLLVWSPESKQLAFVAHKDSHADIFIVSILADKSQVPLAQSSQTLSATPIPMTKRIEPIGNPGSQVGMIVWRGETSIIFTTHLDGKDAMYEVGHTGAGRVRLQPN